MKKTAKIIGVVLGCLLLLFFLLPFLVPGNGTNGTSTSQEGAQTAAQPQVFTSNPLTKLVKSLARLFGKENKTPHQQQLPSAALAETQAKARFGKDMPEDYESQADWEEEEDFDSNSSYNPTNYSDSEENEWVLIPQTAPTGSASGMHEINVKDNAYDRYVKQERSARFNPIAKSSQKHEVPDSKWARFVQPVKRFLGIDKDTPSSLPEGTLAAAKHGSSDSLGRNHSNSNLAKFQNPTTPSINVSINGGGGSSGQNPAAEMFNMLFPQRSIDEAADMVAESKFPNLQDAKQQKARKALREEKKAQYTRYVNQRLEERMIRLAEGQPAPDLMPALIENGCHSGKSPFLDSCEANSTPDTSNVNQLRKLNQQRFERAVELPLPEAPFSVILSRTEPDKLQPYLTGFIGQETNSSSTDPQVLMAKKYQFMLEQKQCSDKNPCYWIAAPMPPQHNSEQNLQQEQQPVPRLRQTINAAGVTYRPYRSEETKQLNQAFLEQQLALLPQDATQEQHQQLEQAVSNTFTPYVLVDLHEIRDIQEHNKQLLMQGFRDPNANKEDLIRQGRALYAGSAQTALQLSQDLGEPYFFYGQNNLVLNSEVKPTTADRANQLTDDLIASAQFVKELVRDIKSMATQESTANHLKPVATKLQQELDEGIKQFDKTGQTPVISLPK